MAELGQELKASDLVSEISAASLIVQSSYASAGIPAAPLRLLNPQPWAPPWPPGSALGSQGSKARQASHQHSSCHWEHSCQQGQESQKPPPKQNHIIGTLSTKKQSCCGILGKPQSSLGLGFSIWLQEIELDDFQGLFQLGQLPRE